jgi:phosphoribosyl 1,2-cyclic phosphate phosphodiesterase
VDVARRIGARRTFFTHLTHETSHAALEAALPADIAPAYDGLSVEF